MWTWCELFKIQFVNTYFTLFAGRIDEAMSLKRLKRRLSQTFRGSRGVDESLSELAESLTIEENGGIKENGEYTLFFPACLDCAILKQQMDNAKKIPVCENLGNLEQELRRGFSNFLFEMM